MCLCGSDGSFDSMGEGMFCHLDGTVLAEGGARPEHIVRLTWYVTSKAEYLANLKDLGRAYKDIIGRHYPAMAQQVRAIAARYNIPYNTGSFLRQYGTVFWRILRYSLPGGKASTASANAQI